ncbi:MAG: TIGR02147 family protein [Proteobacteria bacterium]|nr:MAG: TIGR02147 family protein [Pseudomonadota bacterium]
MDLTPERAILEYKKVLLSKFEQTKVNEPSYSMRRFAHSIGITASNLADVLSGRCGLSLNAAKKIVQSLKMTEDDRVRFIDLVEVAHGRSKVDKQLALKRLSEREAAPFRSSAPENQINIISKWYYLASLEVLELARGHLNTTTLSQILAISESEAKEALQVLLESGFADEENGAYRRVQKTFSAQTETPSLMFQDFHRQILTRAAETIASTPISEREYTTTMFAFDSSRIQQAKKAIGAFEDAFYQEFQTAELSDHVYCLSLQFFPLTKAKLEPQKSLSSSNGSL